MTSSVRPPVRQVIREPLPFPVFSPVQFLKPCQDLKGLGGSICVYTKQDTTQ